MTATGLSSIPVCKTICFSRDRHSQGSWETANARTARGIQGLPAETSTGAGPRRRLCPRFCLPAAGIDDPLEALIREIAADWRGEEAFDPQVTHHSFW